MRIAFVSHWGGRGGAEKALVEIIEATRRAGHTPFCFVPCDGWLARQLEARGIGVVRLSYPWWAADNVLVRLYHLLRLPLAANRLAANLRAGEFDLVYSNCAVVCVGAIAARWAGIPHLWHVHEHVTPTTGHRFAPGFHRATRLIQKWSALVVGASHECLRAMQLRGEVLYLPPVVSARQKNPTLGYTLTCVGRLSRERRQCDAIEALRVLRDRGHDVCLRIVGSGEEFDALERQAHGLPVTFVGMVPDASQEIADAFAVLNCTSTEAFGRVTAEAMALGTPVIASDVGANPELIRHNHTGLLFPLGDVPALARQIERLIDNPDLAHNLAAEAGQFIKGLASPQTLPDVVDRLMRRAACTTTEVADASPA